MANQLVRPLVATGLMLEDIASGGGDLTRRLEIGRDDELGTLAFWFNSFLDKLQPIIQKVKELTARTGKLASESSAMSVRTSKGIDIQFHEVDLFATAAQEMSATSHDVARNAGEAC